MADFGDPGKAWWMAHGILMILAWGFFIPIGTGIAVYRRHVGTTILKKETSFYPMHRNFQTIGFLLTFIAFGLAAVGSKRVYGTGRAFNPTLLGFTSDDIKWNHHVKWGISVLFISGAQVLLGIWHHYWKAKHDANPDAEPWKRKLVPSWSHVVLGIVCMLTAYITMFQGLQIYNFIFYNPDTSNGIKVGYAFVALSGFLFLASYAIGKLGNMMSGAGQPPEDKRLEEDKMEAVEEPKEEAVVDPEGGSSADAEKPSPEKQLSTATTGRSEHFA